MTQTQTSKSQILRSATHAVYLVFFLIGFVFANWAARMPAIRDALGFSPAQMGRLLLVAAIGSILALSASGAIIERIGGRKTIAIFGSVMCVGYGMAAVTMGDVHIFVTSGLLFIGGMGMGAADTAMNFEGSRVEHNLGRSIMPWFHGFFSFGTMAGALIGTVVAWQGVSLGVHVGLALLVAFIVIHFAVRRLLPASFGVSEVDLDSAQPRGGSQEKFSVWGAWKERSTWLIGLVVLGAALTEGAANDWLGLGITDDFDGATEALGAAGLFVFLTAMTAMRLLGTYLLDNLGRVIVLRISAACAVIGLLIFAMAPAMWMAFVGAAFWGLGAALGFPVGMSAATDDPKFAAARLSVVATIGYTAFFAGPPLLGELAEFFGYRKAMLFILIPAVLGLVVAAAASEKGQAAKLLAQRQGERNGAKPPQHTGQSGASHRSKD